MSRVVFFSDWDRIPCQELLSFLIETVYHVKSCYLFWLRPYTMSRVVIFSDVKKYTMSRVVIFSDWETVYHVRSWDRIPCQELLSFHWDRIPCQELLSFLIETVYHVKSCYLFWLRVYHVKSCYLFWQRDRIPYHVKSCYLFLLWAVIFS